MAPPAGSGESSDVIYGLHAVREALRAGTRPFQRILVLRTDRQFAEITQLARAKRVPIHVEPRPALDRLVREGRHQGVIGVIAAKAYAEMDEILECARVRKELPFVVILDSVEDPQNLGAVLRSADAAGVHGVFVPDRRSAGLTGAVAKASAGALDHVRVGRAQNLSRLIEDLQASGLWVYGLDVRASKPYTALDFRRPIAVVLGGEGRGIRPGVLEKCDDRARIPMYGRINSLNVSAAAAVTFFEVVRQRSGADPVVTAVSGS